MRRAVVLLLLFSPAPAFADADVLTKDDVAAPSKRDGLLTAPAALPSSGSARVATGAETTRTRVGGFTTGFVTLSRFQLGGGALLSGERVAPHALIRAQLASAEASGVDVTLGAAYRGVSMMEDAGGQAEVRLAVGRTLGRLGLGLNAAIAQGLDSRSDTDAEGSARATFAAHSALHLGAEGRVRFELADRTLPNYGRPYEATAGGVAYLTADKWQLSALMGIEAPRGLLRTGPFGSLSALVDF